VLVQLTSQRIAELPNIPTVFEFARNEEQRQILQLTFIWGDIARPIAAPPGTPDDRVAILRRAFEETVRDPAFLADAKKSSLGIDPVSGERIAVIIRDVYRTPRAIIDKAAVVLKPR
jgi:tripartite-type tricarboxylate transporter receptor subunit TctC